MSKKTANDPFPVMEHMTVKMVREYLTRSKSIILPMGVIEQHGYHLPLKTDTILANHIGRMVGERTGIIVAPTIHQSFSGGGLPGTINISPAVMSLVVSDMLVSLASQGFRNFYILLCHGGSENARALDNALKLLLRLNPMFENALIALMPSWKFRPADDNSLKEGDWHAGWNETSRVMALEPDLVRMDEMELDAEPLMKSMIEHPDNYQHAEKIVDDEFVVPRMSQRPDIKVGVMGHPEKSSPELGWKIIEGIVKGMSDKILELEAKADGVYKEVAFTPEPILLI
ncbi:MAG: creatininase family protein [Planctomycetota bacterium]|nr:creatininase family protein [Planctomycetota bacterium]